jgi:hypothetical protein
MSQREHPVRLSPPPWVPLSESDRPRRTSERCPGKQRRQPAVRSSLSAAGTTEETSAVVVKGTHREREVMR